MEGTGGCQTRTFHLSLRTLWTSILNFYSAAAHDGADGDGGDDGDDEREYGDMDICQRVGTWVLMVWCVWVLSRSGSFEDSDGEDETR